MDHKRQAGIVLAGLVLCVGINIAVRYHPYTFIRRDASFYATIAMGLVNGGSLDQRRVQPQSWYSGSHPGYANLDSYWSNVSVGRNGVWYPKHSFLISVAAAPFYAAFGVNGLLLFNALCVVGMLWAAYFMAVRFAGPVGAALAVVVTAMSPMLVEHTYLLSADVFNAALIAAGMLSLLASRPATAGALLGIALWARPVTAVLVVPVAAALCWRRLGRRELVRLAIALAIPLGAAALTNLIMYGAPWITSYDRILTVEDRVPRVVSARSLFTNTRSDGLKLMFQNREHGLPANALSGLVSLAGLVALWRHHRALTVALAGASLGFLAVYLPYRYFNARFFFAWQVLLCLPLAVLLADLAALGLRLGRGAQATVRGAASPGRRWLSARWRPVALAGTAVLVVGIVAIKIISGRTYRLVDQIAQAKVFRNDYPCDYFNITHQAWECSRLDRSEIEYPGRSLRPESCRFGERHRDMITLAPPAEGGTRRLRFEGLPRGPLRLRYGLQQGAGYGERCFSVSYVDRPAERLCASVGGELVERQFPAPGAGQPRVLELSVSGTAWQGLCLDGDVSAGD